MKKMVQIPSVLLLSVFLLPFIFAKDQSREEYTVQIPAGERSCFYHPVKRQKENEFEFQVIEGGDVNVMVQSPTGGILLSIERKSEGVHHITPAKDEDHEFCFDNGFSSITHKTVFFSIIKVQAPPSPKYDDDWSKFEELEDEYQLDVKAENIRLSMEDVRHHLDRSVQIQNFLRVQEARDRSQQESNCLRVTVWSCIQLSVMVAVACLQIFLIRSLFEEKSRFNKILKGESQSS